MDTRKTETAAENFPPALVTISTWRKISSMAIRTIYDQIGQGNLPAKKLGRRTLIDYAGAMAWLNALPAPKIRAQRRVASGKAPTPETK